MVHQNAGASCYTVHLIQRLPPDEVVFGATEAMQSVKMTIEKIAEIPAPVLIQGECGTGKETIARILHRRHPGEARPFLRISSLCFLRNPVRILSSVVSPETAQTASAEPTRGFGALTGTLLLSEVAELGPSAQQRLLRLVQDEPALSADSIDGRGKLRLTCTSTFPLERHVEAGNFREDLYYCINVVSLRLPPLRERRQDIPHLVHYFWQCYKREFGFPVGPPSAQMVEFLQQREWPGNIRELGNVLKRYVLLGAEEPIIAELRQSERRDPTTVPSLPRSLWLKQMSRQAAWDLEREVILRTLANHQGNRKRAAQALNISYRTILYKIKKAGVARRAGHARQGINGASNGPQVFGWPVQKPASS